jgi:hypothetical protein
MRNGASFSEMLDAQLGCTVVPPPAPPRAWSNRPLTTPLFAFEPLDFARDRLPLIPARPVRVEAPPPVQLTSLERQTLEDAPTPDALRRAYRTLARRYHPDRHQGCSPAEREQLARLFAEATEHYRLLTRRF